MSDPVTVFLLVVAGLLVVGTLGERVFARTGVPAVIWLIALGVLVRVTGIVPLAVVAGLAPFFAALALVIILFDAGQNLTGKTGEEPMPADDLRRAQLLAGFGFAVTATLVALFSMALYGLGILPTWGWAHAFMLGSLIGCVASEVFLPSLQAARVGGPVIALLRRESAITKALAVAGTVVCLDLLSPRVATGGAGLAMLAGFGFALAFGSVAGIAWIVGLQRLAGDPTSPPDQLDARHTRNYGFTLAVMLVLYVLAEAAGGAGALAVLVFGVTLGNADALVRLLLRRGGAGEDTSAGELVRATLGGHARTIEFVRTLIFALVGLMLTPPWGPLIMGAVLGVLLLVSRLAVARFTLTGLEHGERSIIAASAPRGMATVALATLPLAHAVPGAPTMLTLVFAAVTTSILLFTIGLRQLQASAARLVPRPAATPARPGGPTLGSLVAAEVAAEHPTPLAPVARATEPEQDPGLRGTSSVVRTGTDSGGVRGTSPVMRAAGDNGLRGTTGVTRTAGDSGLQATAAEDSGLHGTSSVVRTASEPGPPATSSREPSGLLRAPVDESRAPTLALVDAATLAAAQAQASAVARAPAVAHAPTVMRAPTPDLMHTLPQMDPLATAMARALARRPEEVTAVRRRTTAEMEVPPPTFMPFPGASEEEEASLLEGLRTHGDDEPVLLTAEEPALLLGDDGPGPGKQ